MKYTTFFCLVQVILLYGCSTRVFYYQTSHDFSLPHHSIPVTVSPDDYHLYLRQVATSDSDDQNPYINYQVNSLPPGIRKLEVEYLFIGRKNDSVIYISNFADKRETVYGFRGFAFNDTVRVNAFYFGKIYIGSIDRSKKELRFVKTKRERFIIHYFEPVRGQLQFDLLIDSIKTSAIARNMTSLAPIPLFVQQKTFYWMFNLYVQNPTEQQREVRIRNNTFYVSKTKGIFLECDSIWSKGKSRWIRYLEKRLAARKL